MARTLEQEETCEGPQPGMLVQPEVGAVNEEENLLEIQELVDMQGADWQYKKMKGCLLSGEGRHGPNVVKGADRLLRSLWAQSIVCE